MELNPGLEVLALVLVKVAAGEHCFWPAICWAHSEADLTCPLLSHPTWTSHTSPANTYPSPYFVCLPFCQPRAAFSSCPSPSWSTFSADPYVSFTFHGFSISVSLITNLPVQLFVAVVFWAQLPGRRGTMVFLIHLVPHPQTSPGIGPLVKVHGAFVFKGEKLF